MKRLLNIKHLRQSGKILASALLLSKKLLRPGTTSLFIDSAVHSFITSQGASPSFIGLAGYEHATCISVNSQIVHGLPTNEALCIGDIVTVDIGVSFKHNYTDAARTFVVGRKNREQDKLIRTAHAALNAGINKAVVGNRVGDISFAIQREVEFAGYRSPLELGGHGIGIDPHMDPFVSNTGTRGTGSSIGHGECLAIEPIVMEGSIELIDSDDGFTICSKDGKLSAHVEDTIVVYNDCPIILTRETLDGVSI